MAVSASRRSALAHPPAASLGGPRRGREGWWLRSRGRAARAGRRRWVSGRAEHCMSIDMVFRRCAETYDGFDGVLTRGFGAG
jgi:hypothetical protein